MGIIYSFVSDSEEDKETHKIVGYEGLTKNYGIGLYISQIAVRNDFKHKGIGSLMVEEAIRRTNEENIDILSADISYDNEYSLALFKKFGFTYRGGERFLLNVKEYNQEDEINNSHKRS